MNIATCITFSRLFVSPIFLLFYLEYEWLGVSFALLPYILLFLLSIVELSDGIDGYIARRYNQVTDFGKIVDPMADSIVRISLFLTMTQPPINLPLLLIFAFIYRDSMISTLRTMCALRNIPLAARTSGKIKAILQGVALFCVVGLMIPYAKGMLSLSQLQMVSKYIVSVTACYAILSGVEYLYVHREALKMAMRQRSR